MKKTRNLIKCLMLAASCLLVFNFTVIEATAAIPEKINIQGVLTKDGKPVTTRTEVTFELYNNAQGAMQIMVSSTSNITPNANGFFNYVWDLSASHLAFDIPYWVKIKIQDNASTIDLGIQPLVAVPYAITAKNVRGGSGYFAGKVGIGRENPGTKLAVLSRAKDEMGVRSDSLGFASTAVFGQSDGEYGEGVYGMASKKSGLNYAVRGKTMSPSGYAGYFEGGKNYFSGNVGIGTESPEAALTVKSDKQNNKDNTARFSALKLGPNYSHIHYGDKGDWYIRSAANDGKVILQDMKDGKVGIGTKSPISGKLHVKEDGSGPAIYALSGGKAVWGYSPTGRGLMGSSITGYGLYSDAPKNYFSGKVGIGRESPSTKLYVFTDSGEAFKAEVKSGATGDADGGQFFGRDTGEGVEGHAEKGEGVYGASTGGGNGVRGWSSGGDGLVGESEAPNKSGLYAFNDNTKGYGVFARGGKQGVHGESESTTGIGVYGKSRGNGGTGVYGENLENFTTVIGVYGKSGSGVAVKGESTGAAGYSGYFTGGKGLYADKRLGGAIDLAENIETKDSRLEAGDVVIIDSGDKNKIKLSDKPYDSLVAGIVSTNPDYTMGTHVKGGKPIALAGRVPCKASDENGPIEVGDLLTTANTPGYAMKATDPKIGTIVGKAMEPLASGKGKIMVLVTLQ